MTTGNVDGGLRHAKLFGDFGLVECVLVIKLRLEADMVGAPVERTAIAELSATGVAHLAGVSAGFFTLEGLSRLDRSPRGFAPRLATPNDARGRWRSLAPEYRPPSDDQDKHHRV